MTPEEWLRRTRRRITKRLIDSLVRQFRALTSYHRPDAERFARQVTPIIKGSQHSLAEAVAESFAERARIEHKRQIPPPRVPNSEIVDLRGVKTEEVYQRPFHDVWRHLAEQEAEVREEERKEFLKEAIRRGETRLRAMADEDLQLTYGRAARTAMQNMRGQNAPTWWKRVPTGSHTCAMCLIISTRTFNVAELNPIHPNCDCEIRPQYGPKPGPVHDEDLLETVHAKVAEELGFTERTGKGGPIDYRDILIEVLEHHGELGTVLVHPRKH